MGSCGEAPRALSVGPLRCPDVVQLLSIVSWETLWLCRRVLRGWRGARLAAELGLLGRWQNKCSPESAVRNLCGRKDQEGSRCGVLTCSCRDGAVPAGPGDGAEESSHGPQLPRAPPAEDGRVPWQALKARVERMVPSVTFRESKVMSKMLVHRDKNWKQSAWRGSVGPPGQGDAAT